MAALDQHTLFPLRDLARMHFLPGRIPGKRISTKTVFRWALKGLRGGSVLLRTTLVGGLRCTCAEWVDEFLAAYNTDQRRPIGPPPRTPNQREQASADARKRLERAWNNPDAGE
jgi:Protein of unknown function (DUF1580)